MKRYVKRIALFLTVGMLLLTVLLWRSIPREPQLWELAQKVASTSGWSERNLPAQTEYTYYYWLNPTELLYFRNQGSDFQGYRLRWDGSHAETKFLDLKIPQKDFPQEVSADGKLLLWLKSGGDVHYISPRVSLISNPFDPTETTASTPVASTGSPSVRRFRIIATDGVARNSIVREQGVGMPLYPVYSEFYSPPMIFSEEPPVPVGKPTPPGQPSLSTPVAETAAEANVFRVHWIVRSRPGPMIQHKLRVERYMDVQNVCVSPDGNRLFFEERTNAQYLKPKWPYRLFRMFGSSDLTEKHIFVVADLKTGRRKELAAYEAPYPPGNNHALQEVHDVQWMRDGKRLSFIFREKLYTLPAE